MRKTPFLTIFGAAAVFHSVAPCSACSIVFFRILRINVSCVLKTTFGVFFFEFLKNFFNTSFALVSLKPIFFSGSQGFFLDANIRRKNTAFCCNFTTIFLPRKSLLYTATSPTVAGRCIALTACPKSPLFGGNSKFSFNLRANLFPGKEDYRNYQEPTTLRLFPPPQGSRGLKFKGLH